VQAKQAETQAEADASFAIPESLRLKEGDSEAERERKRKKVKALKVIDCCFRMRVFFFISFFLLFLVVLALCVGREGVRRA